MAPRTFLIDGSALAYRSFFARGPGPAFAYAASLLALIEKGRPDFALVAMDTPEPTFRHKAYSDYKATREKTPQELIDQLPQFERIARALGFELTALPGWEADDVIGTLALRARAAGHEIFIVTGDKDFLQIVRDGITIWNPQPGGEALLQGIDAVRERFHCRPDQVVDVLALMGDASDNIPGVRHVGEKTAIRLIESYENLDDIYARLDEIRPNSVAARLREGRDSAYLSRDLATIRTEAPVGLELPDLVFSGPDLTAARALFVELDFPSLLGKLGQDAAAPSERTCRVVRTREDFADFRRELLAAPRVVLDLETTSIVALEAEIVGLAFAFRAGEAFYLPANPESPVFGPGDRGRTARERASLRRGEGSDGAGPGIFAEPDGPVTTGRGLPGDPLRPPPGSDLAVYLELLAEALAREDLAVAGQNLKYDLLVLGRYGLRAARVDFDTMLASYVLDAHQSQHGLDFLAMKHLGLTKIPTSALIGKGKAQISMWDVPVERCAEYACEDAEVCWRLLELFEGQLRQSELLAVFRDIEMPLLVVLQDMEAAGVKLDVARLRRISVELGERLAALTTQIHELAGEAFNVASPQQLAAVLYEKLRIHEVLGVKRIKRTRTGFSTDAEVLESLTGHPLPAAVLEHRQLSKLKGTYVDALPDLVHPESGRIHTSFNQAVASTGRLSSSDPNLQNIPIRTELGRTIRAAFVADDGQLLLSADYSQIELRLMAHLSGDEALQAAFHAGDDIHRRTAALVFGVEPALVTAELRGQAKAINFGILYGMGAQRLARSTGLSLKQAQAFIEQYFRVFSGVKAWLDRQRETVTTTGEVRTLTGRRRRIDNLDSADPRLVAGALNMAVNTPLQGSAADLIKLAMIRLHAELPRRGLAGRMLLQVHDELVLEVPESELDATRAAVVEVMQGALELSVPLVVSVSAGKTWAEAH